MYQEMLAKLQNDYVKVPEQLNYPGKTLRKLVQTRQDLTLDLIAHNPWIFVCIVNWGL